MMQNPLKILILEDSMEDLVLIERELHFARLKFTSLLVKGKVEFANALRSFEPDVILADHSLPQFNSLDALAIARACQVESNRMVPFILVTGTVSEHFAVECFKAGVDDYILKDRLKRLPLSIEMALEKAHAEREKLRYLNDLIRMQAIMKEAEHLANFGSWEVDLITGKHTWSDQMYHIYGYEKAGEVEPGFEMFFNHVHPDDVSGLKEGFERALANDGSYQIDFRIIDRKGKVKYIRSDQKIHRNGQGVPVKLVGFNLNMTEHNRKKISTCVNEGENTM